MKDTRVLEPQPKACTKRARVIALIAQGVDAQTAKRIVYAKPYNPSEKRVQEAQQVFAPRAFSLMR